MIEKFKQAGFSDEEIALFKHNPAYAPSEEELNALIATQAISDTLELLPEDIDEVAEEIDQKFGAIVRDDSLSQSEVEEKIKQVAASDRELASHAANLFALSEIAADETEE